MSDVIVIVASYTLMIMGGISGYYFAKWQRAVPGTHAAYVAKSMAKIANSLAVIQVFVWLILVSIFDKGLATGWIIPGLAIILTTHVWILYQLILNKDDDWFSDQVGKITRWMRNKRTSQNMKPST